MECLYASLVFFSLYAASYTHLVLLDFIILTALDDVYVM
jgi:hypothetical protein